jgi:hypothetical protein
LWDRRIVLALIGVPLTALMLWFIFKQPKSKGYTWEGPGPPDYENPPKGLPPDAMEPHRLLQKYGYDPRTAQGPPGNMTLLRTMQSRGITVPAGGGWIITPIEMREEATEEEKKELEIEAHDLGTSFVLEAKATPEDIEGVRFMVTMDSVEMIIPAGNLWLYGIRSLQDDSGRRLFRLHLHDDVLPNRSWVDYWDGVLRVNMPIDTEYTSDGVDKKELRPVIRTDPPPDLREIPDYQKNKDSIYGLRVEESDETFEVTIWTEHQVRDSFKYELEPNILKVYFEEGTKKPTPRGTVIRVKQHEFHITLPVTVLQDSANHRLEDNIFHIYLHKS